MQLNVYDGEVFERGIWWYIIFASVFVSIIVLSLITSNIVGVYVMFLLLGGYLIVSINKKITLKIEDEGLKIGDKLYPWNELYGFVLEIDSGNQQLKNIVLFRGKDKMIYTFIDESENIKEFIQNLYDYIPMYSEFEQSFVDRLSRTMKL